MGKKTPLLADGHHEHARSQAPAWERAVLEALPAEPGNQMVAFGEKCRKNRLFGSLLGFGKVTREGNH